MPVSLEHMRELLLPGLRSITQDRNWDEIFAKYPKPVSLKTALLCGLAATIIRNPIVSRRPSFLK